MSIGKTLFSTEAAPFWIGIAVTCIAAITTSIVLSQFEKSPFAMSFSTDVRKGLMQRLTRDCDAIQSTASVVAVLASELLLVHLNSVEGVVAFCFGGVVVLTILLILGRVTAADYSHYAWGPFTLLVSLLLVLNILGVVLVVTLG